MSTAATAPFSIPLPLLEQATWVEGTAGTDRNVWRTSAGERKGRDATTFDSPVSLILQTPTSTLSIADSAPQAKFDSLFRSARCLRFEDGMDSDFSQGFTSLVHAYGPFSRDILAQIFADSTISPEVLSEALRWIGRMEDLETYEARLWLLEKSLSSPSASVRDGASLGLASMDDPRAIRYLEAAIEAERISDLRHDMEEVLRQLKNGR